MRPRPHTHAEHGLRFPPQYHNINLQHPHGPKKGTRMCVSKKKPSKSPVREPLSMFSQQGLYGERCFVSRANGLFIHFYLSESPKRSPPTKCGENIHSPSTEPHADRRPTYNELQPGSPRGSFTTLLSLPQCHAAFSTIPSILAWLYQSLVSLGKR